MNSTDGNESSKKRRKRRVLVIPGETFFDGEYGGYLKMNDFSIDYDDHLVICEILLNDSELMKNELLVKRMQRNIEKVVCLQEDDKERRVTEIHILGYNIARIPASIGQLKYLTHLDILGSEIKSLPLAIGALKNLTHLEIIHSQIESVPPVIGELKNLTHLDLGGSLIASLPLSIWKLPNLQYLNLACTKNLLELPEEIGNLASLKELILCKSGITSLPPSIGKLQNLQLLHLSYTQILVELPEEVKKLQNLTHLILSGAHGDSQRPPIDLQKFSTNLKVLELNDLSWEGIESLPDSIGMLAGLMHLNLGEIVIPDHLHKKLNELLLVLTQRCPFLGFIDVNESFRSQTKGPEKILFALTCNRIRYRTTDKDCIPMMPKLWPLVLHNAPRAFDFYPETLCPMGYGYFDSFEISKPDAIYQLLLNFRESFINGE